MLSVSIVNRAPAAAWQLLSQAGGGLGPEYVAADGQTAVSRREEQEATVDSDRVLCIVISTYLCQLSFGNNTSTMHRKYFVRKEVKYRNGLIV